MILKSIFICLKNKILKGYKTYKSQPLKSLQAYSMVDIHFAKKKQKKTKSPTIGDLKRSPTVAFALKEVRSIFDLGDQDLYFSTTSSLSLKT